jgi:hypothetical protein
LILLEQLDPEPDTHDHLEHSMHAENCNEAHLIIHKRFDHDAFTQIQPGRPLRIKTFEPKSPTALIDAQSMTMDSGHVILGEN